MTAKDILNIVSEIEIASTLTRYWMLAGDPWKASLTARIAGRYANRLIDLAEKGEAA